MYSLLLDSSANSLSVGFSSLGKLVCFTSYEAWQSQSEHMIVEINKLMEENSISKDDLDSIVCSIGPGSYTGIRISLTIAKTISLALNIPVLPVSSLRVLKNNDLPSICLINARSGRSYFGVYQGTKIIVDDCIKTNEEALNYISEHPDFSVCGDVRYLNMGNNDNNVCLQMTTLMPVLPVINDTLGLKPIYMKD